MTNYQFSQASYTNMHGINPALQKILKLALTNFTKIDFGVPSTGGVRTDRQQNKLYKEGATPLNGYNDKSHHQLGLAVDVFAYVDGQAN